MKIYNTFSRIKEELKTIEDKKVKIYVCGPTVYDYIHIGNARPMIVFDTLRRYLIYKGYEVKYVSNFTDIDDKIINKANKLNKSVKEITEKYIEECKIDMKNMNILPYSVSPKASEEIDEMISLIKTLIDKNYAYEKNGSVFYRTRAFKNYGKLSHKNINDLIFCVRKLKVTSEKEKEEVTDFVLWKPKKRGEPFWDSPWGEGRPGWHTECCAIIRKYLGDEIDIHAGGEDLIFPHHENEIAQGEVANEKKFSRYWMHNAFLNINDNKMSKSKNNFLTVREINKRYDLQILRFFMLSVHYRNQINYSEEIMNSCKISFKKIKDTIQKLNKILKDNKQENVFDDEKTKIDIDTFKKQFEEAMDNDLNTAEAISIIFKLINFINKRKFSYNSIKYIRDVLLELTSILGLIVNKEINISCEDDKLIKERELARKNKNFKLSDEIRERLLKKGIIIEDTREGTIIKTIE